MFKKLVISTIASSLLLSIPVGADHHRHRHCDKVEEVIVEVKTPKDKSSGTKIVAGTLQFVNKMAPLIALVVGIIIARNGPFYLTNNNNQADRNASKLIEAAVAAVITYPVVKYGTAAVMSQEDVKPLKK
jgi:hypothetical protein